MNDNEVPGPFKVRARSLRDDYIDEVEMALIRETSAMPGLDGNPIWNELLQHFRREYVQLECAE